MAQVNDCKHLFLLQQLTTNSDYILRSNEEAGKTREPDRKGFDKRTKNAKELESLRRRVTGIATSEMYKITAEIRKRRTQGESLARIAIELNRRGISGTYGGRWYAASVRAYLYKEV